MSTDAISPGISGCSGLITGAGSISARAASSSSRTAPTELAYIAGLLDGEGCIGAQNSRWNVSITNTYRPVIDWLLRLGGKDHVRQRYSAAHNPCWSWRVHAQQDVLALLEALVPFMIIKRDLAERVIAEIGHRPYRRENQAISHSG